jgi:segregation and condensation protein A
MLESLKETSYSIEYGKFKGPINLLLELVQKKKASIYEIRLGTIIKDFLNHIKNKENILLNTLSGFLYIAAILLEIKSRSILPSENKQENKDDGTADVNILRMREEEYKVYKNISIYFSELCETEKLYFVREAPVEKFFLSLFPDFLKNINAEDLSILASKLLRNKEEEASYLNYLYNNNIGRTLFEEIARIKNILVVEKSVTFKDLTKDFEKTVEKVVCFLSVLELYKNEVVDIMQFESFGSIIIKIKNGKNEQG